MEGKIDDDHWQNRYEPRANTVGKSIQWASGDWSGDPDKNPYKFDIALLFASNTIILLNLDIQPISIGDTFNHLFC